jgi:type IV secretory pathway VirB10-like protein
MTGDPTVQQKAPSPPGNIPQGRQKWIMIAVLGLLIAAVLFNGSSSTGKPTTPITPAMSPKPLATNELDRANLTLAAQEAEYRAEAMREKAREAAQQAGYAAGPQGGIPGQYPANQQYYGSPQSVVPAKSEIQLDREKREYTSLFASNVALSYRKEATPPPIAATPKTGASVPAVAPIVSEPPVTEYVIYEGTIIEAVLTNRLVGDYAGPVNCMVTTAVYSPDHQHLLIPQGARLLGEARRVDHHDQERMAVTFHRLLMQDGSSFTLDKFQGLDQVGAGGLKDKVDHHYLSVFGTSIALGVLSGFSARGTGSALTSSGLDMYRQGVAQELNQSSTRILDRQLNRLPTVTIREGQRVKVYLSADLKLPAYGETHEPQQ